MTFLMVNWSIWLARGLFFPLLSWPILAILGWPECFKPLKTLDFLKLASVFGHLAIFLIGQL